jgi:predicted histone-like DNA-binding protein
MAVNYKAVPKRNPSKQDEAPKFYAQVVSSGDMTVRQLAKQISAISTVSVADTMAVIEAFLEVVPQALADGKIVRLGDFGSFNLAVNSEGAVDAPTLSKNQIKKVSVRFRPGKEFSNVTNAVEFSKLS